MPAAVQLDVCDRLSPEQIQAVLDLVREVTEHDTVRPLSEHTMLHLRHGGEAPARNVLAWEGDELVAYGHLDTSDAVEGASAEVAVGPRHRGQGHGRRVVEAMLTVVGPQGRIRLWSHGMRSGAAELARSMGFVRERVLWQMRRSLYAPIPAPQWPAGVTVRTFVPGRDEAEWLAVNNRAFAQHPDQGTWTLEDLAQREAESWFDPDGFFLAEQDGRIVGFHWTKVHGSDPAAGARDGDHPHEPIGEVYVVGVDPSMQGRRLGPALTLRGLQYLRDRGLSQVMLYVDESNTNAIRVYSDLGFVKWDVDTCFLQT